VTDFAKTKSMFQLPEGLVYLDGNSLGPLPKAASIIEEVMVKRLWDDADYFVQTAVT
jgi:kynureninase